MTDFRAALNATSIVGLILAMTMFVPGIVNLAIGHVAWKDFFLSGILTGLLWLLVALATRGAMVPFTPRFGIILVNMLWWFLPVASTAPLMVGPAALSLIDAIFESASGFTTTGSTVIVGLDQLDRGTLLWRSMTQWMGGTGILSLSLVVLPFLKIGGMQLFRLENSDRSEKVLPRFTSIVRSILIIYVSLTILCAIAYWVSGMTLFDAINHAMATLSTGGFSTHDTSMGYFQNNSTLWVGSFFMTVGGLPFTLFVTVLVTRKKPKYDPQVLWFFTIILMAVVMLLVGRTGVNAYTPRSIAENVFDVVSVITTTGLAAGDYTKWGSLSEPLFFLLTFFGGCAGSTAGGLKIYRLIVLTQMVRGALRGLIHPHGVFPVRYGRERVNPEIFQAALVMSVAFAGVLVIFMMILAFQGNSFDIALSGSLTALANVGPGLGDVIGPSGTFTTLPDSSKLTLAAAMITGRLEIMVVLVLFVRAMWQ